MPRPKQETLDKLKIWEPDSNDFAYGRSLMIIEDCSRIINRHAARTCAMFSPENVLFSELVYVSLSLRERFDLNQQQFKDFLNSNLGTVNNVLTDKKKLEDLFLPYGMGQKKINTVVSIAENWMYLDITNKMRKDINKENGEELRQDLCKNINGLGFKLSSLFLRMCGYHDIAPPDNWAIHFCESRGFVYKRDDSGLKYAQGLAYEKVLKQFAKQYNVTPALFQATIYATHSTWKKDSGIDPGLRDF